MKEGGVELEGREEGGLVEGVGRPAGVDGGLGEGV